MTTSPATMIDSRGNALAIGDIVRVVVIDPARGAIHGLVQADALVVGFGRTRVRIDAAGRIGTDTVAPETLRLVRKA